MLSICSMERWNFVQIVLFRNYASIHQLSRIWVLFPVIWWKWELFDELSSYRYFHIMKMLQDAIYMYYGEMELCSNSFVPKLCLHPSTFHHLSTISSNLMKVVVIVLTIIIWVLSLFENVTRCYLYVLWRDGTLFQ